MIIVQYNRKKPKIDKTAFIAETAVIIGDVTIEKYASIWYGAVLRGDTAPIHIGKGTNVQDNTVVHVDNAPCIIKDYVTVGHSAIIHAAVIEKNCLIGMGATVLSGTHIEEESIIGANALVAKNKKIQKGSLAVGVPAKVMRLLTKEERKSIHKHAVDYTKLAEAYKK
ncbi:MAG: gamma carbonic anhydrase family protein [Caldisericota bacterium]|nr:gamma carbonic anhydrase family protein [Caldisericota bacterium]